MKSAKKKLTFFRCIGGKHWLAKLIVELIPEHEIYVEPFVGAGHVFFAKERSKTEVLNDADSKIANLFYCVTFHYKEFLGEVQVACLLKSYKTKTVTGAKKERQGRAWGHG